MTAPNQVPGVLPAPRRAARDMADSLSAGFICAAESHEDTAQRARRLAPSGRRAHFIAASAADPCPAVPGGHYLGGRVTGVSSLPNCAAGVHASAAAFSEGR